MNKFRCKIEKAVDAFRHKNSRKNGIHLSKLSNVQRVSKYSYQEKKYLQCTTMGPASRALAAAEFLTNETKGRACRGTP